MTAERLARRHISIYTEEAAISKTKLLAIMKDFAAYHVEQALKAASEKIKADALETYGSDVPDCWSTESILNAYGKENIQ